MPKISAAHQAVIDVKNQESRERLAYHHILTEIVRGGGDGARAGRWGKLQRVGSIYHKGDSWVWQLAFSPRLRDAVIMETFDSRANEDRSVRCFFLADVAQAYENRWFDSQSVTGKFQALYMHAKEIQLLEMNKEVTA